MFQYGTQDKTNQNKAKPVKKIQIHTMFHSVFPAFSRLSPQISLINFFISQG